MRNLLRIFLISLALFYAIPVFADTFLGVNYTIIEKSNMGDVKGSIDIRLEEKATKEFLKKLAFELLKNEPKKYERLFISYFLPGMVPGAGAWATSHFTLDLEVKILGTTIEEEKALLSDSSNVSGEIIGEWIDESSYSGAKYTLLKKDKKIVMVRKYKDGSGSEEEMIKKNQSGLLRFEEKGGNDFGEYYLIESDGRLGSYDSAGIISTMRSIK